MYCCYLYQ